MYTFAIVAFSSPTNIVKWTGTVTDDTCPLFALKELANWEATAPEEGDRLSLTNGWFYAEVVSAPTLSKAEWAANIHAAGQED